MQAVRSSVSQSCVEVISRRSFTLILFFYLFEAESEYGRWRNHYRVNAGNICVQRPGLFASVWRKGLPIESHLKQALVHSGE